MSRWKSTERWGSNSDRQNTESTTNHTQIYKLNNDDRDSHAMKHRWCLWVYNAPKVHAVISFKNTDKSSNDRMTIKETHCSGRSRAMSGFDRRCFWIVSNSAFSGLYAREHSSIFQFKSLNSTLLSKPVLLNPYIQEIHQRKCNGTLKQNTHRMVVRVKVTSLSLLSILAV